MAGENTYTNQFQNVNLNRLSILFLETQYF